MDWQNIMGIAAVIVAIGTLAGVGLLRDRLTNLKQSNEELRDRVSDLEKERNDDHLKITTLEGRVQSAEDREHYLQSMLQGRVEWTAISDQVEAVHREMVAQRKEVAENTKLLRQLLSRGA